MNEDFSVLKTFAFLSFKAIFNFAGYSTIASTLSAAMGCWNWAIAQHLLLVRQLKSEVRGKNKDFFVIVMQVSF